MYTFTVWHIYHTTRHIVYHVPCVLYEIDLNQILFSKYNNIYQGSTLTGMTCSPTPSPTQEAMCKRIQESVNMLQQVVEMLPDPAPADERMTAVDPGLQSLTEAMGKLQEQARFSVGFQRLQVW